MSVESDVDMASGQNTLDHLLHTVTSTEAGNEVQKAAVQKLRQMTLDLSAIDRLMDMAEKAGAPVPLRCGAVQVLGHHRQRMLPGIGRLAGYHVKQIAAEGIQVGTDVDGGF